MPGTGIYAGRGGSYTDNGGGNYTLNAETIYAGAVTPSIHRPFGYQEINNPTTPTALSVPLGASFALIQTDAAIRWRDDGGPLTAIGGMLLPGGAEMRYDGQLSALRVIQAEGSARVRINYYT